MKKILKFGCLGIVGFVVLIGILGAVLGRGNSSTTTARATTGPAAQSIAQTVNKQEAQPTDPEPTVAPTPVPTLGQDVQVDQVRWKIIGAEDLGNTLKSDSQFIKDKTSSGRFIKVKFEMENLSKDMLSYAGFDLVDDQQRTFKSSSDAFQFIPSEEQCIFENLNPNLVKTCTVIYEVPANASGIMAQVGDLKLLGNASALIDLNLKSE